MAKKLSKAEKARQGRAAAQASGAKVKSKVKPGTGKGRSSMLPLEQQLAFQSRKRTTQQEESAFSKLSPSVLEKLNLLSSYTTLERPVDPQLVTFGWDRFGRARQEHEAKQLADQQAGNTLPESHPLQDWLSSSLNKAQAESDSDSDNAPAVVHHGTEKTGELRLPKRPRWHSDMDTKTVQSNEAQVFRTWLQQTDRVVEHAFFTSSPLFKDLDTPFHTGSAMATEKMGGSRMTVTIPSIDEIKEQRPESGTAIIGSLYERNIEVYRQLWRVCERSDLICVLADARCPTLHLPPSLTAFLERYMRLKVVIVLTKADIVPKPIVEAWKAWLKQRFPKWEIVGTESYTKLERLEGQGQRARYTPYLSAESCSELFSALRKAHREFITPPPAIREDSERLKSWAPSCATEIDWDGIEKMVRSRATTDGDEVAAPSPSSGDEHEDQPASLSSSRTDRGPPPYLTVGLIGQPNVGKSSLLNALFGSKVVRASKTPGKTKHFQTHFLTTNDEKDKRGQIRLCDSPGLVFPSLVGMETQVMGAILPISQVQAVSSAVRYAAQHMPLEKVLNLDFPAGEESESQKALRTGEEEQSQQWTASLILEAVAERYQWRTAKANRWDTNRAGNLTMRAVAEGKIRWAFRPPTNGGLIGNEVLDAAVKAGEGIWLDGLAASAFDKQEREHVEDVLMMQDTRDQDLEEEGPEAEDEEQDKSPKQVRFEDDDDEETDEGEAAVIEPATSRFAALTVEDDDDEQSE